MNEEYLIWSIEHGAWWRANSNGYTKSRAKAGRYTLTEAVEICKGANIGQTDYEPPQEAFVPA